MEIPKEKNNNSCKTEAFKEYRKQWVENNREKLAEYSRKQYLKKVTDNPEYRQVLVARTLERRKRVRELEGPKPIGRPKKEVIEEGFKRNPGRPRKYNIIIGA